MFSSLRSITCSVKRMKKREMQLLRQKEVEIAMLPPQVRLPHSSAIKIQVREAKMVMLCVVLLILRTVAADSAVDCSPSVKSIMCVCHNTSLSCNGTQDDYHDIVELILNISDNSFHGNLLSIDISIENMTLSPNSSFRNITADSLKLSSGLSYLEDTLFSGIDSFLRVLNLSFNNFDSVPSGALMILNELHILDLSHNDIKALSQNDFKGLGNLKILNLSHNSIKSVESEVFSNLPLLEMLNMDHNGVFFDAAVFKGLHNLNHLSVSGNDFDLLSSESFTMLPSLKTLYADENNIVDLENIQINSTNLQELSVQHCVIQGSLKTDSLKTLPSLISADFSYNNISEVRSRALSALFQLKHLNLSYNHIKTLGKNAFSAMFNLVKLDLQHNDILVIATSAFYNLTKLEYLNLNNNKLKAFLCPYTVDLLSLETIHLENNQIKIISSGAFIYSQNLTELKLSGNELNCTCFIYDFSTYLRNRTSYWKEGMSIKCSSPLSVQGKNVSEVDYSSMTCYSEQPCESLLRHFDEEDEDEDDGLIVIPTTISAESSSLHNHSTGVITLNIDTSDSAVIEDLENSTAIDGVTGLINMSDNETSMSGLTNLTVDNVSVTDVTTSTGLESTTKISESTIFTVLGVINKDADNMSLGTEFSPPPHIMNFSIDDTANYTYSGSTFSNISQFPKSDLSVVTTVTASLTSELVSSSHSRFSSSVIELAATTSVLISDINVAVASGTHSTGVATTKFHSSGSTAAEVINSTFSRFPPAPENFTSHPTDTMVIHTNESTTSGPMVNSFSLGTAHRSLIDIKNYSLTNKRLCVHWSIDHTIQSDTEMCFVAYKYEKNKPHIQKQLKCPSSSDGIILQCLQAKKGEVIIELCIKLYNSYKKYFAKDCVHEHDVDTLPEQPLTSPATYSPKNLVTETFPDLTTSNDTHSINVSMTTLYKNYSSHALSSSTPVLHERMTTVLTKEVLEPQTAFSITGMNILAAGNVITIEWTVNREEPLAICTLKLDIKSNNTIKAEKTFNCTDNSHVINIVEDDAFYDICLTSNHFTFGTVTVCRDYHIAETEIMIAEAVKSSGDYSFAILIGLFVLVVCFVAVLTARAALKRNAADAYNVTNAEQNVSMRKQSGHEAFDQGNSSRFSYNAKEVV